MATFITFYSYKGGVGRTLALANVATLLAGDRADPCRVLVWDFDLGAPGLQEVLKCKWRDRKQKQGFIEYLYYYLKNADIQDIQEYIYPTAIPGVDILPAGAMNRGYTRMLEEIDWRRVYRRARGFQFIEETKKRIAQLDAKYDYVLIDSLTGYSDVGGICVKQLADVVVLLFRLNGQNIEGISKVNRSIRRHTEKSGKRISVVPVVSPVWPFASPEAGQWMSKAEKAFGDEEILEISFEPSLTLGEKVISRQRREYPPKPRILGDYQVLANNLRKLNPHDLRTVFLSIRKLRDEYQFPQATDACIKLVRQRPSDERYWRQLARTVSLAPKAVGEKLRDKADKVINDGCVAGNPHAYIARADLSERFEEDWRLAFDDLSKAIELAPEEGYSYFRRGSLCSQHREYKQAVEDFSKALKHKGPSWVGPTAYSQRGMSYMRLGESEKALMDLSRAITLEPSEAHWLMYRAMVFYSIERYPEAGADIDKALELSPGMYQTQILNAYVLCAQGFSEEAKHLLQQIETAGLPHTDAVLNLAEAYVVVDPSETLRLLEGYRATTSPKYESVAVALKALAAERLGKSDLRDGFLSDFERLGSSFEETFWYLDELKSFLNWGPKSNCLSEDEKKQFAALIEQFESSEGKHVSAAKQQ